MGFTHDNVWSGWVFTYDHDPELRKYSLGHQLLRSMLEESYRRKHREFDFSIGGEDYKWVYSTHARLLGAIGCPPLRQRMITLALQQATKNPALFELARSLKNRAASMSFVSRARRVDSEQT